MDGDSEEVEDETVDSGTGSGANRAEDGSKGAVEEGMKELDGAALVGSATAAAGVGKEVGKDMDEEDTENEDEDGGAGDGTSPRDVLDKPSVGEPNGSCDLQNTGKIRRRNTQRKVVEGQHLEDQISCK